MKSGWSIKYCCGLLLSLILIAQACAPKRHLASKAARGEWLTVWGADRLSFFEQLDQYHLDFQTVNARSRGFVTINDNDNHEANIQVRMRNGEAIWVSVTAFLGMEVGRLLITPDSIRVLNRLDRSFLIKPYTAISDFTGKELAFGELENLLLGNAPDSLKAKTMELGLFLEGGVLRAAEIPDAELHFNNNFRLTTFKTMALEINHEYSSDPVQPGFPAKTSVAFRGSRLKLIATLEYSRLILDQPVEMPFSIPKGYDQIH